MKFREFLVEGRFKDLRQHVKGVTKTTIKKLLKELKLVYTSITDNKVNFEDLETARMFAMKIKKEPMSNKLGE